ncbi:hypothetical protein OAE44_00540 [bacterium]|nr:hypothetical protein [bacterium]
MWDSIRNAAVFEENLSDAIGLMDAELVAGRLNRTILMDTITPFPVATQKTRLLKD